MNLQTQLACLKEQAAQSICSAANPNLKPYDQLSPYIPQDNLPDWSSKLPQYEDLNTPNANFPCDNTINESLMVSDENCNISSSSSYHVEDANDLHSIAFGYSMKPS